MSKIPRCLACGDKLPVCSEYHKTRARGKAGQMVVTGDGQPPTRGKYGDNVVCSLVCAQLALARVFNVATEKGIDLRSFLPYEWRPDLVPWKAWQTGARLKGKRAFVVDPPTQVTWHKE